MSGEEAEWLDALWFAACVAALIVLFAAGLRVRVYGAGWRRWALRIGLVTAAAGATLAANIAVYRHDAHLDFTREQAFTPSREAQDVVRSLQEPVELVYFYQKDNPAGRSIVTMLELLGHLNPRLVVEAVDIDRNPARASALGVRLYNTAIIRTAENKVEVVGTDDREIALGILRALRRRQPLVCFVTGHGEYDIDNFEFHTHFEGAQGHSHGEGAGVVLMEQHGLGRLRRAVEKLGLATRKVELATGKPVPGECNAVIDANPRTPYGPGEADIVRRYLQAGGSYMLLVEPDYAIEPGMLALLSEAGAKVGEGLVVDPVDHYFTDEQMVAVTRYSNHPVTRSQALSFYPGVRPVEPVSGVEVKAVALFASGPQSYVAHDRLRYREEAASASRRPQPLAVAAEGKLGAGTGRPFRLLVVGDADFASNSFFPYLANADVVLAAVSWLLHEDRLPTLKPPVEVLPQVSLTNPQVRWIFILTVILLPGAVALTGAGVWLWRRR